MTRKINTQGLELIKKFEGCKLTAYKCPAGVLTIGYGHTGDVVEGQTITKDDAVYLLTKDLEKFETFVENFSVKYNYVFNDNEFSALVSFCFNCGCGNLSKLTDSGRRDKTKIVEHIILYNKANGKVLKGLTNRREAEKTLFLTPCSKYVDSDDRKYYAKPTIDSVSIIEMLSNINEDYSYKRRKTIATLNGILNYTGTATQNLRLIELLKQGLLIKE